MSRVGGVSWQHPLQSKPGSADDFADIVISQPDASKGLEYLFPRRDRDALLDQSAERPSKSKPRGLIRQSGFDQRIPSLGLSPDFKQILNLFNTQKIRQVPPQEGFEVVDYLAN